MPCVAILLALLFPRLVIVFLVLTGDYIGRAYETLLWPLMGFFFLPITTLTYAYVMNTMGVVEGPTLVLVIVAVLVDVGVIGIGKARRGPDSSRD